MIHIRNPTGNDTERHNFKLIIMEGEVKIPKFTLQMELMKTFLRDNYRFRRNVITGGVEYLKVKSEKWAPLTKEVLNRMTFDAIEAGIEVWDKDIRRYVESTFVEDYDPVADYMGMLPRWDGRERIEVLARRVPTENRDWPKNFHRWFLGMVRQWVVGRQLYGNTMVPLLIGRQGDGKSTFCRQLIPEELQNYYTDRIDFTKRTDAERVLTRFVLVNVDEFDSISKSQNAFLKHLLQKSDVMVRKLYETQIQQMKRYASFIATTNDPTPLVDTTGSRRFMCIQTSGTINTKAVVNHQQLYAQAMAEIEEGARTWFDRGDERRIQLANAAFQQFDSIEEVFSYLFHRPGADDIAHRLSPYQILEKMHERYASIQVNLSSAQRLGKLLMRRKFKMVRTAQSRMYYVSFNDVSK